MVTGTPARSGIFPAKKESSGIFPAKKKVLGSFPQKPLFKPGGEVGADVPVSCLFYREKNGHWYTPKVTSQKIAVSQKFAFQTGGEWGLMYQCRVCFIERVMATGTPPKMTSQETGDFPAVAPQGNGRHKKPRRFRHARTPGGIPDTNEVCCVL